MFGISPIDESRLSYLKGVFLTSFQQTKHFKGNNVPPIYTCSYMGGETTEEISIDVIGISGIHISHHPSLILGFRLIQL